MRKKIIGRNIQFLFVALIFFQCSSANASPYPISFVDHEGKTVVIEKKPENVVSLVPSITEIIFQLGAGDTVKGITYHSSLLNSANGKTIIGGFFEPSIGAIEKLNPDLIFVSDIHDEVKQRFANGESLLVNLPTESISSSFDQILLLGKMFDREKQAADTIAGIKRDLDLIEKKIANIPDDKRKRVIRLMGRDQVMTPGSDSFQNELIRAAGGITHDFNRNGKIIDVSKEEWMAFNPQVIYGCGGDRKTESNFLNLPGWEDVDGVKNRQVYYFPCDLTCRAATHTGYFISWLAARMYGDEFSKKKNLILEEKIFKTSSLDIDLDYIKNARIAYSHIYDFVNKTLIIDLKKSMHVVSTLEGQRRRIKTVGNHFAPPAGWAVGHKEGLKGQRAHVYQVLGQSEKNASFLFTAADMDNLSIKQAGFKELKVYALVTAGVKSNAMRMSRDQGNYYEPGTINMIIMTNMKLTPRAMTRAIISATEGKSAALLDMDIRSSYQPVKYRATGTGTDNMIVAQGSGTELDNAGGHSKLGELIARAVYDGVKEAVYKQNGLETSRNIFMRLKDRNITISGLILNEKCDCGREKSEFVAAVEERLLESKYADFLESAFALSDDYEKGLVTDLTAFHLWAKAIAEEMAGRKIPELKELVESDALPTVICIGLNAVLNGVYYQPQ